MPTGDAMRHFVQLLTEKIPSFKPWLDERLKEKAEEEERERELQARLERERLERIWKERAEKERVRSYRYNQCPILQNHSHAIPSSIVARATSLGRH
jgi:hypothetical protein